MIRFEHNKVIWICDIFIKMISAFQHKQNDT